MTNDLQVKRRIEVVKERMLEILKSLASEVERGVITSQAELQHRVYVELQRFYESIGKPNFKQIEAWGPPYSSDHNTMMEQILNDLYTLYKEIENMTDDIQNHFEQIEMERQNFIRQISEIESFIESMQSQARKDTDVYVFQDSFVNMDYFDQRAVRGLPTFLSVDESVLTLYRTHEEDYNTYASITIIDGNGIPGNTHIVRSIGDSLKFEGEEELHIDMASMIDNNSDTWFEYEIFELPQQTIDITQGKDFRYKEPVEWAKQKIENLRCIIQITLSKEKDINWISISPYIPFDRGAVPAKIEKVVISDEKGAIKGFGFEEDFDAKKAYIFPKQKCKIITIYLRQDTPYPVFVGHFFYKHLDQENISYYDIQHPDEGIRVHGNLPSIENLGISYDTNLQEILYPIVKYGDTIKNVEDKKRNLFTTTNVASTGERVLSGLEQVFAYRYMIGVKDIRFSSYKFAKESEYVSIPFTTNSPIQEVTLKAKYDIPEIFGEGNWVQFFISINDGKEWHEIHPVDLYKENIKTKYIFNSNLPKEGRLTEVGYIDTAEDIYQIRFKISLKRPIHLEHSEYFTPVIYSYELNVIA